MKITALKTFVVPPRWLFLKIETDEGVSGWGEPVVEGRALTVQTAVEELSDYLIGADPMQIEDLWNVMYRGGFYRGGPILMSAIAGIDQALWDIKGKAYGQPIHQLLGGLCRKQIRVYSWIGGDRPADVASNALEAVARGFTALKMNGAEELQIVDSHAKIDRIVETIGTVRDAVGPHIGLAADFHGRVHRPMAKVLIRELEPDRGLYAGAVGWTDDGGDGEWYVSLRCAQVASNRLMLHAGAGIVAGSDPAAELAETAAKFRAMLRALDLDGEALFLDAAA